MLKSGDVLGGPKAVTFQYIAEYRGTLTRSHLCRLMGVSERGLHAWKHRPPSLRQRRGMVLLAHIRDQHRLSLGSYGRPRMTQELNELGIRVGQRPVGRLMRQNDIQVIRSRKFKRTTDSDHAFNIAPNLLQQDFTASGPNQKCAGDITYVWTRKGCVYLAVIIDLFSRRTLNMAAAIRRPPAGCVHHTDCGSQYCAHHYQKLPHKHGIKVSMRGKGNCYDNSAVESFFKSLKAELIWRRNWQTRREVEIAFGHSFEPMAVMPLLEYINGFYNPRRKHSALSWKSPVAFEQRAT